MTAPKGPVEDQVRAELLKRLLALPHPLDAVPQISVADLISLSREIKEPLLSETQKRIQAHEERFAKIEKELADLKSVVTLKRVQAQPVKREGPLGQFLGGM